MCVQCGTHDSVRGEPSPAMVEAMSMVLAIALTREQAAALVGASLEAPSNLWPSSLYRVVADTALRFPDVWRRCSHAIEAQIGAADLADAATSVETFCRYRDCMTLREAACVLWTLVKGDSALLRGSDLIVREVEVLALSRLGESERLARIEREDTGGSALQVG